MDKKEIIKNINYFRNLKKLSARELSILINKTRVILIGLKVQTLISPLKLLLKF